MRLPLLLLPALMCLLSVAAHGRGAYNPIVEQSTIATTICIPGYAKSIRPSTSYTNGVKAMLLRRAGISQDKASEYELDHIVPLALGGHSRMLENLELQLLEGHDGARRKDRLEVKLHCLVCSGQINLDEARRDIAWDWQEAYHRHAKTKCNRRTLSSTD